jgi:DNA-binding winged helix-turn-helix (wHTH) protein
MYPRCFDALLLLIENRGGLLEKDFLLQALWPDVVVDENSLAKVISEVRRALGEGPRDSGCIVTVPRRGYRFVAEVAVHRNAEPAPAASGSPTEGIRSLAVLPFSFLHPSAEDETLSIGLADALITRLGQLRRTVLRPTSSITRFADQRVAPAEAGRTLGVDAVIAGSVRRAGTPSASACSWCRWPTMPCCGRRSSMRSQAPPSSSRIRFRIAWPLRSP